MYSETDERNAWLALKSAANRMAREIDALTHTHDALQENINRYETIRTERSKLSLPDKMMRRGMYSEEQETLTK